ncbi:hypothetical protein HD806DRAFT_217535 [Xylariaceae sp. AK1471]|nr:hypothetical protein HD806DRAFT_217535 [Xylariaceae sp. AK1471]
METAATQSFLSRRPAAGGLPQFHLPPPNTSLDPQIPSMVAPYYRFPQHYPSPPPTSSPSESRQETSSPCLQHSFPLPFRRQPLTSSSGVTGSDSLSPLSSSINSNSSHSSQTGITQQYHNQNGWSMPSSQSYTYGSITPGGQSSMMSSNYNRHIYSPGGSGAPGGASQPGYSSRNSQSPATTDGLAHPSYDSANHPFSISLSGGGTSHSSFSSQPSHPQHLQILNSQTSQPPTPAATASSDNYSRAPPTPGHYAASSSTPQQSSFPAFHPPHPSPTQLSPTTTGAPARGPSTLGSQQYSPMGAPPHYGSRPYYPTIPSGMGGAVLSNMGNPGGQMSIMGGINPLGAYHAGHPLGHHSLYPGAPNSHQDRPYRCDTCPQSFNRNHDLKRHKRIHLAVKPFPCGHCDKSFSRKDALKRHRMVKGCGNGKTSPKSDDDGSPMKTDPDETPDSSRKIKNEPA